MRSMEGIRQFPSGEPLRPKVRLVRTIAPEEVRWLWRGRMALGKMTVLDGDPGLGKSTLTLELAARISRGEGLPGGPPINPGAVLLLSAEDGEGDTIRPRLEHAKADMGKVGIFTLEDLGGNEHLPSLSSDLSALEQAVTAIDAVLVVIDPLVAFLGGETNANRDQDVRRTLAPLASLAGRTGCAILLVRHLNKMGGGSALYRGGGSIGIIGAARFGLVVERDPDDRTKRVLAIQKCNIGPEVGSLSYELIGVPGTEIACVKWHGSSTHTADELLDQGRTLEERASRNEGRTWLFEKLAAGPIGTKELQKLARDDGVAWRSLEGAKAAMGVIASRTGFGAAGTWSWALPVPVLRPVLSIDRIPIDPSPTIDRFEKTPLTPIDPIDRIDRAVIAPRDPFTEE